jgi:three-Cys-motif partner protein
MMGQLSLFSDLPKTEGSSGLVFGRMRNPIWTENKAKLVARYLYYFVLITRHGAYIDGFAAPQEPDKPDSWAAKLVLESEPKFLKDFWLCDLDKQGCQALESLADQHRSKSRRVGVIGGDFNERVGEVLASDRLKEKTATFCLLDQRTFECDWKTIEVLARHKSTNKIELFYFLATGWLDRSFSAISVGEERVRKWWGREDWRVLQGMSGTERAELFCRRFRDELGYTHAHAWPILSRGAGGRVMYHRIHGTDHPEAPKIMARAYKTATRAPEPMERLQADLGTLWGNRE